MTSTTVRLATATTAIVLTAIVASGCTAFAAPETAPSVAATATGPTIDAPATTATPSAEVEQAAPTCENIIPQATADDFKSLGWSSQSEPFRIGATAIDDGIQCKWGDQSIASDRVQIFGWAPIDEATATAAQDDLIASGWKREVDDTGTYITENPEWLGGRGVDGYGLTYLFTDGAVRLADTRQSLALVTSPRPATTP